MQQGPFTPWFHLFLSISDTFFSTYTRYPSSFVSSKYIPASKLLHWYYSLFCALLPISSWHAPLTYSVCPNVTVSIRLYPFSLKIAISPPTGMSNLIPCLLFIVLITFKCNYIVSLFCHVVCLPTLGYVFWGYGFCLFCSRYTLLKQKHVKHGLVYSWCLIIIS